MNYHFAEAIRAGEPPFLDVYRGVAMSIVGIQAYRSVLDNSNTVEVPDFRQESQRRKYAKDNWSPDPAAKAPGQPPPSMHGFVKPPAKALAYAKKIWKKGGYEVI